MAQAKSKFKLAVGCNTPCNSLLVEWAEHFMLLPVPFWFRPQRTALSWCHENYMVPVGSVVRRNRVSHLFHYPTVFMEAAPQHIIDLKFCSRSKNVLYICRLRMNSSGLHEATKGSQSTEETRR